MSIVKVKTKYQVTLPSNVRQQVGVAVGDILEAKVERGKITLSPKTVIDRRLAEGLEDLAQGRVHGPFKSADALLRSLQKTSKRPRRKSKRS